MTKVTIDRALIEQALYVIDAWERDCDHSLYWRDRDDALVALRAALAEPAVEQQLMRLLASAWFYGGWKAETNNEKDMETLMIAAGWWPFKDEDALFAKIAAPQAQQPAPVQEHLLAALKAICDEQDERQGYASCKAYDKARAAIAKAESGAAPKPAVEPIGYFRAEPFGWTDCAPTDEGAKALYEVPPPAEPARTSQDVCTVPLLSDDEVAQCIKDASKGSAINRDGSTSQRIVRSAEQLVRRKARL